MKPSHEKWYKYSPAFLNRLILAYFQWFQDLHISLFSPSTIPLLTTMKFAIIPAALAIAALFTPSDAIRTKKSSSCSQTTLSCSTRVSNNCCSPAYGLVVLVQQWVPGYGPSNAFTMHGLWPDTCSGGDGPSNGCDSKRQYSSIQSILKNYGDKQLYSEMQTYWPSDAGPDDTFWVHEWGKHGTCVTTLAPTCYGSSYKKYEDVHDYFKQALSLRSKYDLYKALSKAGINPGSNPDVSEMHSAIRSAFGVDAEINCDNSGTLSEIWLYFKVKGTSTYVLTHPQSTGSCSGSVNYPTK
ncbi:base non specific RNase Rh [Endogone sp. FLAS-F59071]|nr:base non specific RNase Rh [Endogone sp. FLAS-F59071]|eukprot:RUS20551.1 base non specific RNase Rh [Endogone sp. FLAS-F59071]